MEVILSTAFGVQPDVQTDQDEPYTPNAALLFRQPALSISLSKYSNDSRCRAMLTNITLTLMSACGLMTLISCIRDNSSRPTL